MPEYDRTQYILQVAHQLGLSLPEEEIARVTAMFGVLEAAAGRVRDASLHGETIAAAVFRPEQGSKK
jgi:hypothetical protein